MPRRWIPDRYRLIEGACRHLVSDRMDLTGARWSLAGAEAVLRLRALRSSGDFDEYWRFPRAVRDERNHASRYADGKVVPSKAATSSASSEMSPYHYETCQTHRSKRAAPTSGTTIAEAPVNVAPVTPYFRLVVSRLHATAPIPSSPCAATNHRPLTPPLNLRSLRSPSGLPAQPQIPLHSSGHIVILL